MNDPATEPQHPVMRPIRANTDSPGRYDFRQWMWPLPPPGRLTVVCEWPSRDIPETRVKLDADAILGELIFATGYLGRAANQ